MLRAGTKGSTCNQCNAYILYLYFLSHIYLPIYYHYLLFITCLLCAEHC